MGANPKRRLGELTKVAIRLADDVGREDDVEVLWARPLGGTLFQLKNVPFLAYGFSFDDVVDAPHDGDRPVVQKAVKRSGHSTYRIFVAKDEALFRFQEFWQPLERLGCNVERAGERLFSVDVPPQADIYIVNDLLEAGANALVWDFEEGHVGHSLKPH
jgi:hypothetical protein